MATDRPVLGCGKVESRGIFENAKFCATLIIHEDRTGTIDVHISIRINPKVFRHEQTLTGENKQIRANAVFQSLKIDISSIPFTGCCLTSTVHIFSDNEQHDVQQDQ